MCQYATPGNLIQGSSFAWKWINVMLIYFGFKLAVEQPCIIRQTRSNSRSDIVSVIVVGIIFLSQIAVSHYSPSKLFSVHWPRFFLFMSKILVNAMLPIGTIQNCWTRSVLKIQETFCSVQQQLLRRIETVLHPW